MYIYTYLYVCVHIYIDRYQNSKSIVTLKLYFKNTKYSKTGQPILNVSQVAKNNHNLSSNECITVL